MPLDADLTRRLNALRDTHIAEISLPIDWDLHREAEEEDNAWWDTTTVTFDDGREFNVVVRTWKVHALITEDGECRRWEYDVYEENHKDDDGNLTPGALTESEYDELFTIDDVRVDGPVFPTWWRASAAADPAMSADMLRGLPVCVVEVDGEYGIALTAAGQDLTWELCEAFVRFGALPPAALAESLRDVGGRGKTPQDQLIVEACLRSLRTMRDRTAYQFTQLAERAQAWGHDIHRSEAMSTWTDNSIQFPRLIAELNAAGAFTAQVMEDLSVSMDLDADDIRELIDRAEAHWQNTIDQHTT